MEIATHLSGARNDSRPTCHCEERSDEAISDTIVVVSKQYYVYIMTNSKNTVLYVGVTNDLTRRVYEHKEKLANGFTRKYNITKVVYYEVFEDIENAILREKQLKAGSRQKKVQLINSINRNWHDLYDEL
jgi:putative endonuclease